MGLQRKAVYVYTHTDTLTHTHTKTAGKMAWWIKVSSTEIDDLNLGHWTDMKMEGENQLQKVLFRPPRVHRDTHVFFFPPAQNT